VRRSSLQQAEEVGEAADKSFLHVLVMCANVVQGRLHQGQPPCCVVTHLCITLILGSIRGRRNLLLFAAVCRQRAAERAAKCLNQQLARRALHKAAGKQRMYQIVDDGQHVCAEFVADGRRELLVLGMAWSTRRHQAFDSRE
jgi:hypothetical protein